MLANCSIEDLHTYGISILHGWVGAVLLLKHISSSNTSVVAKQLVNGHEKLSVSWPKKILRRKERKEAAPSGGLSAGEERDQALELQQEFNGGSEAASHEKKIFRSGKSTYNNCLIIIICNSSSLSTACRKSPRGD
jgi:hypothetical protein